MTAELLAELVETTVPSGRAHLVGLSGRRPGRRVLGRRPDLVDRAVIDGAGVLTSRSGPAWLAGVSVVSPFLHTRPVIALFSQMIGMDQEGRADLRELSSPRAFRRAFIEGFRSGCPESSDSAGPRPGRWQGRGRPRSAQLTRPWPS